MAPARTRRQEQAEATREAFLATARELFGKQGYAATSVEAITGRLHAARGSLYHHFESKEALLREVIVRIEGEIMAAMFGAAAEGGSAWERVENSCQAFLDACAAPDVQRIFLLDSAHLAPDPEEEHRLYTQAEAGLRQLFRDTGGPEVDAGPVSYALLGVLQGLARFVADADDPASARRRAGAVIHEVVSGLAG